MKAALKAWAWHTALGHDTDTVMQRLQSGERAWQANPRFDARSYACTTAAGLPTPPSASRHQRHLRRMGLHAVEVATQALAAAQVKGSDRVGLFFGYGGLRAHWDDLMPAFEHQRSDGAAAWDRGLALLHPFWMLQHLSNNAHAIAAQALGACGEGSTFGGGNAGAQALAAALRALQAEAVDTAVVVGYDSLIEPETVVALSERGALSPADAATVSSPYDLHANGFVPGEAAAAVVLQRLGTPGGTVWSHLQALDAADGTPGEAQPATLERLLRSLAQPGDAVDGAGMAQPRFDLAERETVAAFTGDRSPLLCTASAWGQLGAAAAVVQAIALTACLHRSVWLPIAGLRHPAPGPLRPLRAVEISSTPRAALGVSVASPGLAGLIRVELP
ncbi:MAG: beta-ketoacyl synthase N-terminal-like domain-containing protein [Pseudomonadota bacterium]